MATVIDTLLQQLGTGDNIHDYQHAARIFTDSNMRRSPKYAFLFYVKFNRNQAGNQPQYSRLKSSDVADIGALAKSVNLPKFTIENKVLNAYNRVDIAQTKLKYDPVTIKFHDDSAGLVREFWYDYYSYYYRDTDHTDMVYNSEHKYVQRQRDGWGYGLKPDLFVPGDIANPAKLHYLDSISIYSMSQKQYHEYVLVNPTITTFQHGEHNMSETSGLMEHTMTVQFETVRYRKGNVTNETMAEMLLHYDKSPSPLSPAGGGTRTIFGTGGAFDALSSVTTDLASGNFLAAFITAARVKNTFKGANIGDIAKAEGQELLNTSIRTGQNPLSAINIPSASDAAALFGATLSTLGGVAAASAVIGGVQATQSLVGNQLNSNTQNTASVTNGATPRDEAVTSTNNTAQSNGEAVSTPLVSLPSTTIAGFPELNTDNATSGTTFVIPASADPLASINNADEAIPTGTQGTPV